MLVLGLILVALAVLAGLGIVIGDGGAAPLSWFDFFTIGGTTVATVFLAGIVVTAVFFIGLSMMTGSARRSRRHRKELKETRRTGEEQRKSTARTEEDKARLQDELAKERGQRGTPTG